MRMPRTQPYPITDNQRVVPRSRRSTSIMRMPRTPPFPITDNHRVLPRSRRSAPAARTLAQKRPPAAEASGAVREPARHTDSPARTGAPGACAVASSLASVASSALAAGGAAPAERVARRSVTAWSTACALAAASRVKALKG